MSESIASTQLYVWTQVLGREGRKLSENLDEVLGQVKEAGFPAFEGDLSFFGRPGGAEEVRSLLQKYGLKMHSVYTGGNLYDAAQAPETVDAILTHATDIRACGAEAMMMNPAVIKDRKTDDQLAIQADWLNTLGGRLRDVGLGLWIHNHAPEMADDGREVRSNLDHTDPGLVGFCADTHWIWRGGGDPYHYLERYADRVGNLHLRNSEAGVWSEELGEGDLDHGRIAQILEEKQISCPLVVELAIEEGTPQTRSLVESEKLSRELLEKYLRGIGGRRVHEVLRISDSEIEEMLTIEDVVRSCAEAFRLYGDGKLLNPPRREAVERDGDTDVFRLELPGVWPGRYRSRKLIEERSDVSTGRLGTRTAMVELEDLHTGRHAILDAETITNMRTGAAGALGASYLADRHRRVAVLGTGRIGKALAMCADQVLRPVEIRATSRKASSRDRFEEDVGPRVNAEVRTVGSVDNCLEGVDAVLTAVPTPTPILGSNNVLPSVHVSAMGGDPRTLQLDADLLNTRDVVVDHAEQAMESGEFLVAEAQGRIPDIRFVTGEGGRAMTIGDAALGRLAHLRGTGAVAYFTGLAVQDLHLAATAYERVTGTDRAEAS